MKLYMNCVQCGHKSELTVESTGNYESLWYAIYPEDKGAVSIEGLSGRDASDKLSRVISVVSASEGFNDNTADFLHFLMELLIISKRNPIGKWRADR